MQVLMLATIDGGKMAGGKEWDWFQKCIQFIQGKLVRGYKLGLRTFSSLDTHTYTHSLDLDGRFRMLNWNIYMKVSLFRFCYVITVLSSCTDKTQL